MFYDFQPYDVLQVARDGKFVDFATVRDQNDAIHAKAIVDAGSFSGQAGIFRIVGSTPAKLVKYWKLGQNQSLGRCYCGAPITTILEWDIQGLPYGPDYLCRTHAMGEAETILRNGGSPRLGNV